MSIKSEVLRDLVTQYQTAEDPVTKSNVFKRILMRVDRLLISKATQMQSMRMQLRNIDPQDLYQCAIVGLYRALEGVKNSYTGDNIQARILSYVKEEIRKTYLGKKRRMFTIDPSIIVDADIHGEYGGVEIPEFTRMEIDELIAGIKRMVENKEIARDDFEMLVDSAVNGLSFSEIGRRRHLHYTTVSGKVKRVKEAIADRLG